MLPDYTSKAIVPVFNVGNGKEFQAKSTLSAEMKRLVKLSIAKLSQKDHILYLFTQNETDVFGQFSLKPDTSGKFPVMRNNHPVWVDLAEINLETDFILVSIGFEGYASSKIGFRAGEIVAGKSVLKRVFIPVKMSWDVNRKAHTFDFIFPDTAYTHSKADGFELCLTRRFTNSSAVFSVSDIMTLTEKKLRSFVIATNSKVDDRAMARNGKLTRYGEYTCRKARETGKEAQIAKLKAIVRDSRTGLSAYEMERAILLLA